ncbi:hypothetical protein [Stygiolobus caldivivus]|nr:hypothetical protein [Stygiolobus caldivivus]
MLKEKAFISWIPLIFSIEAVAPASTALKSSNVDIHFHLDR